MESLSRDISTMCLLTILLPFTVIMVCTFVRKSLGDIQRGSYMSAHVLLNLFNELGKRDKMRGCR